MVQHKLVTPEKARLDTDGVTELRGRFVALVSLGGGRQRGKSPHPICFYLRIEFFLGGGI